MNDRMNQDELRSGSLFGNSSKLHTVSQCVQDESSKLPAHKENSKDQNELEALRNLVNSLQQELTVLKRRVGNGSRQRDFVVAQYNILAEYLGDNRQPWFLYGLTNLSKERRQRIFAKFYERNESGSLVNKGWPNYVDGILTEEEKGIIETFHAKYFVWSVRKMRILQTIKDLDADLVSLVECDNYETFFKPEMEKLGYGSIYKQRPRQCSKDGCAIFYNRYVFHLEASKAIEFDDYRHTSGDCEGDGEGPCPRDRVGLLTLLHHEITRQRLIFASTHLARNPEDPKKSRDRAKQVSQLLYHLTKFASKHDAMNVPVMLAGDMNATNVRDVAGVARVLFQLAAEPAHPFMYTAMAPRSMPTSVTTTRKVCIDYLLLQATRLEIIDSFEMERLSTTNPIPNEKFPSDHLPLVFRVGFKKHSSIIEDLALLWVETILAESEWRYAALPKIPFVSESQLRMAFNFFDVYDEGKCNPDDFAMCLGELKKGDKIDQILNVIKEKLGHIITEELPLTPDDFIAVYQHCLLHQKSFFRDRIANVYSYFDLDATGDGLHFNELKESFIRTCPFKVDVDGLKIVYDKMDADHDGVVTFDEFFDYLIKCEYDVGIKRPSLKRGSLV